MGLFPFRFSGPWASTRGYRERGRHVKSWTEFLQERDQYALITMQDVLDLTYHAYARGYEDGEQDAKVPADSSAEDDLGSVDRPVRRCGDPGGRSGSGSSGAVPS